MTKFADPGSTTVAGPKPPTNVLRGPEHADNYRIKVGRFKERWYRDPLPYDELAPEALAEEAYPSVSSVKGASGKDWTYTSLKRVAHAGDLPEIATKGFYERYERFKVINQLDLSAAMRRGTNVHTWAECIAYGVPQYLSRDTDGSHYFDMVDKLFAELNPTLIAAEFVCIHRTLNGMGYGGTSDGIFEIDGKRYMVDWKSRGEDSDHGCYPEEAAQIGAYTGAEYVIVADDDPSNPHGAKRARMPKLDGGLIVSIKPDSYEVYPIDLEPAIAHFGDMHAWWVARRTERSALGPKWAPRRAVNNEPDLTDQLHESRKQALYARHDKLSAGKRQDFTDRIATVDASDLDVVEQILDDIENPPRVLDMAKDRMAADADREADRRLSLEGGEANEVDIKLIETRWEIGMDKAGRAWISRVVAEAEDAGFDLALKSLNSQRRVDIYCALTEWVRTDYFDPEADELFRGAIAAATDGEVDGPLGGLVGELAADEAATLRALVTKIEAGDMAYVVSSDPDKAPRWESFTSTTSES